MKFAAPIIRHPLGHVRLITRTGRARTTVSSNPITPMPLATWVRIMQSSLKTGQPRPSGLRGGAIAIHAVLSTPNDMCHIRQRISDGENEAWTGMEGGGGKPHYVEEGWQAYGEARRLLVYLPSQVITNYPLISIPPREQRRIWPGLTGSQSSPLRPPSINMVGSGRERLPKSHPRRRRGLFF